MYFRFQSFYRPMIWGSENWIISAYPHMESRVQGGLYANKTLSELVDALGPALLGHRLAEKYDDKFPLLVKVIDAKDKLSIQVHPSDEQAQRQNKGTVGKTEMWYGLKSAPGAYLLSGLRTHLTPQTFAEHVANHTIENDIARYEPKEGDCFFLSPGRIHSVGAGCHLLEIQQTNDLTYRIYDYDRRDAMGNARELHTDLAAECIDYTVYADYETHYERKINAPMELVRCPYFETKAYQIAERESENGVEIDWSKEDRFLVMIVTKGEGEITIDREPVTVHEKDALLLPATTKSIVLKGTMTVVTTTAV